LYLNIYKITYLYIKNVLKYLFVLKYLDQSTHLSAYYLVPISSLYRCTVTVFYRCTATLYRCTAANVVISKAGIHSPILSLRSF